MEIILKNVYIQFVKFPSCNMYYVIDFFEMVFDFTFLQLLPHILRRIWL